MFSTASIEINNNISVLHWNYRGFKDFPPDLVVNGNSSITDIYLKENNIVEFPRNIYCFQILRNLYLSGNDIKIIPKQICFLQSLKTLDLCGNLLTDLPEEISRLRNLKHVLLDDNKIQTIPHSLWKLKKLKTLSVSDNQLYYLPQRPISNFYETKFEYWRNITLQHIPFSIWLHTMIDKEIQYQFAGCFLYPYYYKKYIKNKIIIKLRQIINNTTEVVLPCNFTDIQTYSNISPPSLTELSKRECFSIFESAELHFDKNNNIGNDETEDNQLNKGLDGSDKDLSTRSYNNHLIARHHETILPNILYEELLNGPTGFCDICKAPLFRYAIVDVAPRPITTIAGPLEILVSAYFCSGKCCQKWRNAYDIAPFQWELA